MAVSNVFNCSLEFMGRIEVPLWCGLELESAKVRGGPCGFFLWSNTNLDKLQRPVAKDKMSYTFLLAVL